MHQPVPVQRIGFGIGTDKCDTRSSCRGSGERRLFGSVPALEALSVGFVSGRRPRHGRLADSKRGIERPTGLRPRGKLMGGNGRRMTETKNPGDPLSVGSAKRLPLKRPVEAGIVRQSFSPWRSKAVV